MLLYIELGNIFIFHCIFNKYSIATLIKRFYVIVSTYHYLLNSLLLKAFKFFTSIHGYIEMQ